MTIPNEIELAGMTPMLQQYYSLRAQSRDAVLFFRMGDFYEVFGDQAEEIAPKLEIAMTSRERGDKQKIPFCGVPHHSANGYWTKLLNQGYRVAIADQVEDAGASKGLVKREIVKTLSPGCLDEIDSLNSEAPNYVLALLEQPDQGSWALVLADISTGELRLGSVDSLQACLQFIELLQPKELICRRFCHSEVRKKTSAYRAKKALLMTELPEAILRDEAGQEKILNEVFSSGGLDRQPCGDLPGGKQVLAALLLHFKNMKACITQFLSVKPLSDTGTIELSDVIVRDLELFETNQRREQEGSLFKTINFTLSPLGARALRWSLAHPWSSSSLIQRRQNAVAELFALGETELKLLRDNFKGLGDVQRLATRIIAGSARPQELLRMRESLRIAGSIAVFFELRSLLRDAYLSEICETLAKPSNALDLLDRAIAREAGQLGLGDGVFQAGYNEELDLYVDLAANGQREVDEYLQGLKDSTGISNLKIKGHKTFGLLVEVTKSNLRKVPESFVRRQTMVNCERFATEELRSIDEKLSSAKDQAIERERELYAGLLSQLTDFKDEFMVLASSLASLDLVQCFAWLAVREGYCRPSVTKKDQGLLLQGSRHPVVEYFVGRHQFVPNTISIRNEKRQLLITGPNMAGKSTVMRQVAISAILHQIGAFVPAEVAQLPVFDNIYTRVGASDDLSRGLSTFMVEMSEAALILRNSTENSLVICDELGRGTSTEDGLALASAVLEHVALKANSWLMFATHFHELVGLASRLESIDLVQTEVFERGGQISFSHRLVPGASGSSFGIEVAKLAGVPEQVIVRAKEILEDGASKRLTVAPSLSLKPDSASRAVGEPVLHFEASSEEAKPRNQAVAMDILERIAKVKIERVTPIQAINILNDLKDTASNWQARELFEDGQK